MGDGSHRAAAADARRAGRRTSRAPAVAPRWRPTSATASPAARAAASRGCRRRARPRIVRRARSGRRAAAAASGGRLAAGGGDRDRPARRDAVDRRADRPRRRRRPGAGAGRQGRRGDDDRFQRDHDAGRARFGGRGHDHQRVARGHRRVHDPAQHRDPRMAPPRRPSTPPRRRRPATAPPTPPCSIPTSTPACRPGNYVIYSGVYTDRKSAEVALEGLRKSFPEAAVVEVASGDRAAILHRDAGGGGAAASMTLPRAPAARARSHREDDAMSPSPIKRLKPYFKTRPTKRPRAPSRRPRPPPSRPRRPPRLRRRPARLRRRRQRPRPRPCRPRQRRLNPPPPRPPRRSRLRRRPPRRPRRRRLSCLARREQLSQRYAELESDLGGLVYEMAIRDHFRLDVLVRRAAELQAVDAELTSVEQALGIATPAAGGGLPGVPGAGRGRRSVLRALRLDPGADGRTLNTCVRQRRHSAERGRHCAGRCRHPRRAMPTLRRVRPPLRRVPG